MIENSAERLTLSASDADGDSLTWSTANNGDGALFQVNPDGTFGFRSPPSFETPLDSDANNIYEFPISVSDGTATTSVDITITVENSQEGIDIDRIATSLANPIGVTYNDTGNHAYVASATGQIWRVSTSGGASTIGTLPGIGGNVALLDIALSNLNLSGGRIVALYRVGTQMELRSYDLNSLTSGGNPVLIWSADFGGVAADISGELHWDGDQSSLFLVTNDGGQSLLAQDESEPHGKLFRWDFDVTSSTPAMATPELRAVGLRDPMVDGRRVMDRTPTQDEVHPALIEARVPYNFGWPYYDGPDRTAEPLPGTLFGTLSEPDTVFEKLANGERTSFYRASSRYIGYWMGDSTGRIVQWVRGATSDGQEPFLEDRSVDHQPDIGSIDNIVVLLETKDSENPVLILDADGELFVGRGS